MDTTPMLKIDEQIMESNKIICRQISRIGDSNIGEVSQEVLVSLRHFVEHILLKIYANGEDIEDSQENVKSAVKQAKNNSKLKHIVRFHHFLQVTVAHRVLKEENAERLMRKYYEYLLRIRMFLHDEYSLDVLADLEQFPLEMDEALAEYYRKIAEKVNSYDTPNKNDFRYDRFYIQRIKPFFVNSKIYYEVAFVPANNWSSKTDRVIAFTDIEITDFYAVKFAIASNSIEIVDKRMPIRIIVDWEVSIRPCEFENFTKIFDLNGIKPGDAEQRNLSTYLTENGFSLSEVVMFSDEKFQRIYDYIVPKTNKTHFFDYLQNCRTLIKQNANGSNILRYLLHHMENRVIKEQFKITYTQARDIRGCHRLSGLYLNYKCIPFDEMPFCSGLKGHVPSLSDLFECLDAKGREHELLAWIVRNNTEHNNLLFTPLEYENNKHRLVKKTDDGEIVSVLFEDVESLSKIHNVKLYNSYKQQLRQLIIERNHIFIKSYKEDTIFILKTIIELSTSGIDNYYNLVNYWLQSTNYVVDSEEKKKALISMFSWSRVAVIYGSAGTGKSTLINHISHLFANSKRLYLAQTNPAVNNIKRKVTASGNSTFITIAKFTNEYYDDETEFDILIIDECSTVNNNDMRKILERAKFSLLVLVGDTYQIEAIEFGNWFDAVRSFLPETSVCELTEPYRGRDSKILLNLWNNVRKMTEDVFVLINGGEYSAMLDESIFTPATENEIILCLNYGGLYGINNINYFLQENNNGMAIQRGIHRYKVGDPILFNDSADKFFITEKGRVPIIHNNIKGRIAHFELQNAGQVNECIQFDIEIERPLSIDMHEKDMGFTIIGQALNGNSIIRFSVHKNKSTDEDDDSVSKAIVPFQIAYAVSIHKAQGLEYDSVKIIITEEIDELITHSIFYTAITRARKKLKIYWTESVERKVLDRVKPNNSHSDIALLKNELISRR
jgi:energy-coupling factor transporter ATP-binding protein EcfA2